MLLAQETDTIENLARSGPRGFETLPEIRIFHLQTLHSLRIYSRAARRGFKCLHAGLGLKRAPPECRKLVSQMSYELLQLFKSFQLRTFAV